MSKILSAVPIDQVEVFVPEQYQIAQWYQQTLGPRVLSAFESWVEDGSLMISGAGGGTNLALFKGEPRSKTSIAGHHRVSFRVDAISFQPYSQSLTYLSLVDDWGQRLTSASVVDHGQAFSIDFRDPWNIGNEITSFDVATLTHHFP